MSSSTRAPASGKASKEYSSPSPTAQDAATDEQLMVMIQSHDEVALKELYRRHTAHLRGVAGRVLHHAHDIDDALQDVFIEVWKRAGSYVESRAKVSTWLSVLARRRAIDRCRHRQQIGRTEEKLRLMTNHAAQQVDRKQGADEAAQVSEQAALLQQILRTLPVPQCTALRMSFYGGMSQREISRKTGVPLGTIKTRLELGLNKLRLAVAQTGGLEAWAALHHA